MNSILRKQCDYESPKSNLLKIELEGMLCTSQGVTEVDGNHEGFGSGISFSWDLQN